MKERTTSRNSLLLVMYYFYSVSSISLLSLLTFLNLLETIEQLRGNLTAFNQLSMMTTVQLQIYCVITTCIQMIILTVFFLCMLQDQKKKVVITATCAWLLMIGMFVFENLTRFSV